VGRLVELSPRERLPRNASYVVIVEEKQQSGPAVYVVTASIVERIGGPMPAGGPFSSLDAALAEAENFAAARNLPCVYFRRDDRVRRPGM
jgi:hypothetical protein